MAVLNGAHYEFEAHAPIALAAGLSAQTLEAVRQQPLSTDQLSPQEQLVLELTDAMTREIVVSDALYARIQAEFGSRTQLDLVATVAAYNMVSRLLVALHIGH